jgi:hypothetical protein
MPQLNVETFVTQYLWLVIILSIAYYKAYNNLALAEIIKIRRSSNK